MSLKEIRAKKPLVHCITNYVVANFTANGLLAIGASPIMADEVQEMRDMASIVDALLINIGTVNEVKSKAMKLAGQCANERGIPVVLDPVGVGASKFRMNVVQELLGTVKFDCIRCNTGELAAIAGVRWDGKGVDSGTGEMDVESVAIAVAKKYSCLVVVTGSTDIVTDGRDVLRAEGGDERMTEVTGTGCLLSAICTAALASTDNALSTLQNVLQDYKGVAIMASHERGIGSFGVGVLNALQLISRGEIG
ncbi:hydroxyethylthiazole kinase [Lysinibacillus sp. 54212]|uniref:hydroxyethylthiazole kinase n=1 Tax=Lysinibacillus sp. 54212 TaxID=3119829 RepID=UPI002FC7CFBB